MLLLIRSLLLAVLLVLVFLLSLVYALFQPFHRDNVHRIARYFGKVSPLLGVKVIRRGQEYLPKDQAVVFVGNHQNNYDLFIQSSMVPKGTVSIGKKSLVWIPLFGQLYWLSGNILIDRANRSKAIATIENATRKIRDSALSVWIFPEGTRSRGRGLLPFKSGAFHTAIQAGVPIVPVISSCQNDIHLGRRKNGVVIVEAMEPICTAGLGREDVRELAQRVHDAMQKRFDELSAEARRLGQSAAV
ncbi:1-acylglycerol-3-phosphate O-acyltransferase [Ferrimonas balearica]|uniref:1-acylglycerol-3-phosphate O-acyltransferase n=1 Tax=Ferrimonas balearica TaxID=44012 RepID=UPI002D7E27E9|nr:1-acylglycerol-3-phosphate O-acyltransferase [Ferrimonas balearica]MBY6017978.1 1-acylglycerol-3-phosphate O-acyltransferase [Halomonas denitrificans]MBY6094313.1 1-acylglycerol-3-phosphate O-acyltransferase [Ferrimonas balearica]